MAHAGTPTDLTKQPATSGSMWKLLLNGIVILAVGLALAVAASFLTRASTVPAIDRGYDQIEKARGAMNLSGVTVDTSYDAVEKARNSAALSGVAIDTSYDAIENLRALSGVTVDTSYDAAEKARGGALSGTTIDPTTFDRTPRGARGQLP